MDKSELVRQRVALAQELVKRRSVDPLRLWTPTAKQAPFIASVLDRILPENWMVAANRSGKTDGGAYIASTLARFGNPDAKWQSYEGGRLQVRDKSTSGWVITLDFPTSRDVVQPKLFHNGFWTPNSGHEPFIPPWEYDQKDWRVSDQILRLKNGSIIGFKSCESGAGKFQGAEKDWIWFDEEPPKSVYDESTIRVGTRPLSIFGTCTLLPPEGEQGGVSWLYSEKLKPIMDGTIKNIGLFNASIYDNPHLASGEIERLEDRYPEGSIIRRIRLDGEILPGLSGARAYAAFDHRLHVRTQPEINRRRPIAWVCDFNVSPLCSLVCQRDGPIFRVYREIVLEPGSIPEMAEEFKNTVPLHKAEVWIYGDATGKHRNAQTGKTDYTILLNEMKSFHTPCRLKVPEINPPVVDRVNAVNQSLKTTKGEVYVEIDPMCKELIDDLEQVRLNPRGGIKKSFANKDPYSRRTHTSDAFGYWLSYENPVRATQYPGEKEDEMRIPGYGH